MRQVTPLETITNLVNQSHKDSFIDHITLVIALLDAGVLSKDDLTRAHNAAKQAVEKNWQRQKAEAQQGPAEG